MSFVYSIPLEIGAILHVKTLGEIIEISSHFIEYGEKYILTKKLTWLWRQGDENMKVT